MFRIRSISAELAARVEGGVFVPHPELDPGEDSEENAELDKVTEVDHTEPTKPDIRDRRGAGGARC